MLATVARCIVKVLALIFLYAVKLVMLIPRLIVKGLKALYKVFPKSLQNFFSAIGKGLKKFYNILPNRIRLMISGIPHFDDYVQRALSVAAPTLEYIVRRTIQLVPVITIISIGIFAIVESMPGDPITAYLGEQHNLSKETVEQMKETLGLNGNVVQRYFSWIKNMLTGDFGISLKHRKPVSEVFGTFMWNTFILNIVTTVVAYILAMWIGIRSATKKDGFFDGFWTVFTLIFVSIPTFVFGLLLIYIFPVKLGLFPLNGMVTPGNVYENIFQKMSDIGYHMILPGVVLICAQLASYVRYIRSSMLEVINQDYIRTARAKGLSEKVVIYKHALRNAMIPIVTLMGSSIAALFTGALMLETVFSWPGMGKTMIDSIHQRDMPLMLVLFLFYALMTLFGNFLADIGYALVDPRVRLED